MISDYFSLAVGNLKHRGLRSWLTIIGIFIGIAAVVSLISLGAGLKTAVTGQFSTLSVDKLTVQNAGTGFGPPGSTVVEKLNEHDLRLVENVKGVDVVVPRLVRVAKVEYNKELKFNFVADIPSNSKQIDIIYSSLNLETENGRLLKESDKGKVVIGKDIVDEFSKNIEVGKKIVIQRTDFEVIGILKPGSSFQINQVILMPTPDLKELLNIEDEIDIIIAQVENKDKIEEVAKSIEEELRKDRNLDIGEEDFSVQTPIEALGTVNTILNIINLIVIGIAAISLLVGGVGIMNTMYTSVLERTREIGIMKAVGAQNKDILLIFLIESGLLGLIGGIIGAGIGLGLAFGASFVANNALGTNILDVAISFPLIISAILFSLVVGIISGTFPAIQASKLSAVDAIRS